MTTILRVLLCGLVVVAPWWCGAVTASPHFYLGAVLIGLAMVRFIQNLFPTSEPRSAGIPLFLMMPLGFLALAGCSGVFGSSSTPWSPGRSAIPHRPTRA